MTKEQYMDYSECRQASFTYKKAKKFRDWVEAPMNDEIAEVLGYLSWEECASFMLCNAELTRHRL